MNLQTSFLTPPFGFALFYLRSVAAKSDYKDRITGATIPAVTTGQIYKGSIAFIVLQVIMVAVIIAWPKLVIDGMDSGQKIDLDKAIEQLSVPLPTEPEPAAAPEMPAAPASSGASGAPGASGNAAPAAGATGASGTAPAAEKEEDPMKALLEAVKEDNAKGKK